MSNSTDWLDNLDTLPDLRKKAKAKPQSKPKGTQSHIKGETSTFIAMNMEQYSKTLDQSQRGFGGDIIPPVFRRYLSRELAKATYKPIHILGISPVWPEHLNINW